MTLPSFLRLIRWKNILLMGYFLGLLNWVLFPKLSTGASLPTTLFVLFSIAILAIQAGGYIINDMYDLETDAINKPKNVVLSDQHAIEKGRTMYKTLNVIGVSAGIWFSMQLSQPGFSMVFIGAALLLFYYAKKFKSNFLTGNILVSILASLPILILGKVTLSSIPMEVVIMVYFVFTFSLIREIVKDCQDVKGDYKAGCKTIPIVLGTSRTVVILRVLLVIVILSLVGILYAINDRNYLKIYMLVLLIVPLLWLFYKLDPDKKLWNFKQFSTVLKLLFFIGMNAVFFI